MGNKEKYLENNQNFANLNYINHPFYNSGGVHNNFEEIKQFIMTPFENSKVMLKRDDEENLIFDYIDCKEKLLLPIFYKSLIKITPEDKADLFTKKLNEKYSSKCKELKNLLDPIMSLKNIPPQLLSKYYSRIYTSESGFYKDLNRDLRENKRDEYLPYIKVLYEGIKSKSLLLASNEELYRGSKLSIQEFEKIKNFIKSKKKDLPSGIVFSKTFLSFTKDKKIAENFLLRNETPQDKASNNLIKVLFILKKDNNLDYTLSTHADMEKLSFFPPEREVLFFPFSSFAIDDYKENELCGNTRITIIYLFYLGKYVANFQREMKSQMTSTPISPGIIQSQIIPTQISPGIIQSQITPTQISPGMIQSQIIPTQTSTGMIQSQITPTQISPGMNQSQITPTQISPGMIQSLFPSIATPSLLSGPNMLKQIPDSNFKNELLNSGLIPKEKIKLIKVGSIVNEFQKHKEEIKKVRTIPPNEEKQKTINNIYPKTYVTRIYEKDPEPPSILEPEKPEPETLSKPKPESETLPPTQPPPIIINQNNYITAEINIDKNNINKSIRVINSYEEYKRSNLNLKVDNESRYKNEKDIKNCEIKINENQMNFFYFYKFSSPGKYRIQYSFPSILTKTDFMFANCEFLEKIDFINFNSKYIYNMSFMFYRCTSLKYINFTNFFTKRVTDMNSMFNGCESLDNLDLSYFNTQNVKNMSRMFFGCKSLKKLNASNFNTEEVLNMYSMFSGCRDLEDLNLSSFNTRNVKNMSRMFSGCSSLKYLDIWNFNTFHVLYMYNLFYGDASLKKINMSNFNTQNVFNMDDMFQGCNSLFPQNIISKAPVIRKVNYRY